ncbi:Isopentenyl-diphosphate Delta-isomerase [Neolecta irregularis DAH-3]|uniref:isopentenyl-diphosphate Delta-isomerase n=1 Tax=Neolecta irregularis (strain DAH-3) TaxID=1198029 RepID=A0A1U7LIZ4_NEOID|nr:Isopentenyl-diphosphate Delta-isomerase [Neolecta irregularis DAH-3]|eukprot:OLL22636.1 Isopentenyl-diphosphate Delta-isomerase [Neolecta irregularis DAH-3]
MVSMTTDITTNVATTTNALRLTGAITDIDLSLHTGLDQEQIRLMDEVCIVVGKDDKPVGSASKKTCHLMTNIKAGLLHRAFSVFLFNTNNQLLLQKRADGKITFPQMWTNTCCSHPLAIAGEYGDCIETSVEGVKIAAQRKLEHELGIPNEDVPLEDFHFLTRIHYLAPSDVIWGEHEIDYILFIQKDVRLDINLNEVSETRYVTQEQLKEMLKDPMLSHTPWFKLIYETFLYKWWNELGSNIKNIQVLKDLETIHRM